MKKEELLKQIDEQAASVSWLDTVDLEGDLDANFARAQREQIAEWVREFSLRHLRKLRDWANEQKD